MIDGEPEVEKAEKTREDFNYLLSAQVFFQVSSQSIVQSLPPHILKHIR